MRKRATAVIIRNGRVLLVRDKGRHHFSLLGGAVKRGEPVVSTAAREVFEELGLHVINVNRLPHCDFRGAVSEHDVCLVEANGEPHIKGHELDKFIWWDMKKPLSVYAHVKSILRKI
jgi:ADP-ribose pyrophosphatase YjhB (NUDIX family)